MNEPFVPIVGVIPFSTTDYPSKLSAVLFTQGCPFHCTYCHNGSIAWGKKLPIKDDMWIHNFLMEHLNFLDAVVISGGEPTQHTDLNKMFLSCKAMGYQTALHTNGYYPDTLQTLLSASLVDYLAMDVKAPAYKYEAIVGLSDSTEKIQESIKLIISSGIEYEFRTTYHPDLLTHKDMFSLMDELHVLGATTYYIQRFQPMGVTDIDLVKKGQNVKIPTDICEYGKKLFPTFGIR